MSDGEDTPTSPQRSAGSRSSFELVEEHGASGLHGSRPSSALSFEHVHYPGSEVDPTAYPGHGAQLEALIHALGGVSEHQDMVSASSTPTPGSPHAGSAAPSSCSTPYTPDTTTADRILTGHLVPPAADDAQSGTGLSGLLLQSTSGLPTAGSDDELPAGSLPHVDSWVEGETGQLTARTAHDGSLHTSTQPPAVQPGVTACEQRPAALLGWWSMPQAGVSTDAHARAARNPSLALRESCPSLLGFRPAPIYVPPVAPVVEDADECDGREEGDGSASSLPPRRAVTGMIARVQAGGVARRRPPRTRLLRVRSSPAINDAAVAAPLRAVGAGGLTVACAAAHPSGPHGSVAQRLLSHEASVVSMASSGAASDTEELTPEEELLALREERHELALRLLATDAALAREQTRRRAAEAEAAAQRELVQQLLSAQDSAAHGVDPAPVAPPPTPGDMGWGARGAALRRLTSQWSDRGVWLEPVRGSVGDTWGLPRARHALVQGSSRDQAATNEPGSPRVEGEGDFMTSDDPDDSAEFESDTEGAEGVRGVTCFLDPAALLALLTGVCQLVTALLVLMVLGCRAAVHAAGRGLDWAAAQCASRSAARRRLTVVAVVTAALLAGLVAGVLMARVGVTAPAHHSWHTRGAPGVSHVRGPRAAHPLRTHPRQAGRARVALPQPTYARSSPHARPLDVRRSAHGIAGDATGDSPARPCGAVGRSTAHAGGGAQHHYHPRLPVSPAQSPQSTRDDGADEAAAPERLGGRDCSRSAGVLGVPQLLPVAFPMKPSAGEAGARAGVQPAERPQPVHADPPTPTPTATRSVGSGDQEDTCGTETHPTLMSAAPAQAGAKANALARDAVPQARNPGVAKPGSPGLAALAPPVGGVSYASFVALLTAARTAQRLLSSLPAPATSAPLVPVPFPVTHAPSAGGMSENPTPGVRSQPLAALQPLLDAAASRLPPSVQGVLQASKDRVSELLTWRSSAATGPCSCSSSGGSSSGSSASAGSGGGGATVKRGPALPFERRPCRTVPREANDTSSDPTTTTITTTTTFNTNDASCTNATCTNINTSSTRTTTTTTTTVQGNAEEARAWAEAQVDSLLAHIATWRARVVNGSARADTWSRAQRSLGPRVRRVAQRAALFLREDVQPVLSALASHLDQLSSEGKQEGGSARSAAHASSSDSADSSAAPSTCTAASPSPSSGFAPPESPRRTADVGESGGPEQPADGTPQGAEQGPEAASGDVVTHADALHGARKRVQAGLARLELQTMFCGQCEPLTLHGPPGWCMRLSSLTGASATDTLPMGGGPDADMAAWCRDASPRVSLNTPALQAARLEWDAERVSSSHHTSKHHGRGASYAFSSRSEHGRGTDGDRHSSGRARSGKHLPASRMTYHVKHAVDSAKGVVQLVAVAEDQWRNAAGELSTLQQVMRGASGAPCRALELSCPAAATFLAGHAHPSRTDGYSNSTAQGDAGGTPAHAVSAVAQLCDMTARTCAHPPRVRGKWGRARAPACCMTLDAWEGAEQREVLQQAVRVKHAMTQAGKASQHAARGLTALLSATMQAGVEVSHAHHDLAQEVRALLAQHQPRWVVEHAHAMSVHVRALDRADLPALTAAVTAAHDQVTEWARAAKHAGPCLTRLKRQLRRAQSHRRQ